MKCFLQFLLLAITALALSSASHAQCTSINPLGPLPTDTSNQHQWCTAGANISQGQIVSLNSSGNVVPIPHNSTIGAFGIAQQNAQSGQTGVKILISGRSSVSTDNACAIGNQVGISSTNDGNGHCSSSATTQNIGAAMAASTAASSITVQISALSSGTPASGTGCTSLCSYVLTTPDQQWAQTSTGTALGIVNTVQAIRFFNNAQRGLGNACFRLVGASAGGHVDIGVYSITGTLLWHFGAQSTQTANQNICASPTPVTLSANTSYYLAWTADNIAATLAASANTQFWQFVNLGGAPAHTFGVDATDVSSGGVLPATIAPGNIVNAATAMSIPYVQVFL